jgi:hypothetical protein
MRGRRETNTAPLPTKRAARFRASAANPASDDGTACRINWRVTVWIILSQPRFLAGAGESLTKTDAKPFCIIG